MLMNFNSKIRMFIFRLDLFCAGTKELKGDKTHTLSIGTWYLTSRPTKSPKNSVHIELLSKKFI